MNYQGRFENDDLPCRLHEKHVVFRGNRHFETGVNDSLQVAGGSLGLPTGVWGHSESSKLHPPEYHPSKRAYVVVVVTKKQKFETERGVPPLLLSPFEYPLC